MSSSSSSGSQRDNDAAGRPQSQQQRPNPPNEVGGRTAGRTILSFLLTNIDIQQMPWYDCFQNLSPPSNSGPGESNAGNLVAGGQTEEQERSMFSPVVRVFGSSSGGQSACVYVHGVVPYFYIRPSDMRDLIFADIHSIQSSLDAIVAKIEEALREHKKHQGWKGEIQPAIFKTEIVNKKSLYGYYADDVYFVKLYCKNYTDVQKICTLLTDTGIFGQNVMQCYEAHIPPLLQFLQDYNLHGMNWMHVSALMVRQPLPISPSSEDEQEGEEGEEESDGEEIGVQNVNREEIETEEEKKEKEHFKHFMITQESAHHWSVWGEQETTDKEKEGKWCMSPELLLQKAMNDQDAHVTDNLTPSAFQWSQTEHPTTKKYFSKKITKDGSRFPKKMSTCEIEVDIHCSHILNMQELDQNKSATATTDDTGICRSSSDCGGDISSRETSQTTYAGTTAKMSHMPSLTALWEEEKLRRKRKKLPPDNFQTPPYTDTTHRTHARVEEEFVNRFNSLAEKGELLRREIEEAFVAQEEHEEESEEQEEDSYWSTHRGAEKKTQIDLTQAVDKVLDDQPDAISLSPFEDDRRSDDEDDDDNFDEMDNGDGIDQNLIIRLRHHPQYREEREKLMTQRECNDIVSGSQFDRDNDGHDPVDRDDMDHDPVDRDVMDHDAIDKDDMDNDNKDKDVNDGYVCDDYRTKQMNSSSFSEKEKYRASDIFPLPPTNVSSRRRPSCSDEYPAIIKRPKVKANDRVNAGNTLSSESPLPHQDVALQGVVFPIDSPVPVNISFADSSQSSQSSKVRTPSYSPQVVSQYTSLLCYIDDTIEQARVGPVCLLPIDRPPSYSVVYQETTKAPPAPISYLDKRKKDAKMSSTNSNSKIPTVNLNYGISRCLVPCFKPPSLRAVTVFMQENQEVLERNKTRKNASISQLLTPTQTALSELPSDNRNMKRTDSPKKRAMSKESQFRSTVTVMSVEVFCHTDKGFSPNPQFDSVLAVAWIGDKKFSDTEHEEVQRSSGVIYIKQSDASASSSSSSSSSISYNEISSFSTCNLPSSTEYLVVDTELALFDELIRIISLRVDPDFVVGYEVQHLSLGYLAQRGTRLGLNFLQLISRFPMEKPDKRNDANNEFNKYAEDHDSGMWVSGRSVLNLWRVMSGELKLSSFDLGYVVQQVLGRRFPKYSNSLLKKWFHLVRKRNRVISYLYQVTDINLQMMDKLDIIRRTSEYARLYGIDFYSVLSRGSQYRVEAVLIRISHSLGFIAASGTKLQVSRQAGLEAQALVMEPESGFYDDPVVVLDFQSLYPSMMIAYNMCYSTIIGKMKRGTTGGLSTSERLGFVPYPEDVAANWAHQFRNNRYIAPNGSAFCSRATREGILPKMLKELLATRQMIKRSMKLYKKEESSSYVLNRVLDARQLALKMLSNVTYGYCSASFSGRMPMAELADAIVQSGRMTLQWTKRLIERDPEWQARVVYGDTDSVFVLLRGRTKEQAFAIGKEIADRITSLSPEAVVLKLEKVYTRCFMISKKRYVGYSYESPEQKEGSYDAKGIETQRRDNCPATQKIQEKSIRLFFNTRSVEALKEYLTAVWTKMHSRIGSKLTLQDFVFNKAVKWGRYKSDSSYPPGAIVSFKKIQKGDVKAEPPYGWRVPYLVVWGSPKAILRDLVFSPEDVLKRGSNLNMNHVYYITKVINPALDRIFRLCSVDINQWYSSTPRAKPRLRLFQYRTDNQQHSISNSNLDNIGGNSIFVENTNNGGGKKQISIESFVKSTVCEGCGVDCNSYLCLKCSQDGNVMLSLNLALNQTAMKEHALSLVCQNCCKVPQNAIIGPGARGLMVGEENCTSLSCSVFFERCRLILRVEDLSVAKESCEEAMVRTMVEEQNDDVK